MKRSTHLSILLLLFGLGGAPAFAQFSSGIEGTVHDSTGAVIKGAEVTATDTRLGVAKETTTNDSGQPVINIEPGDPNLKIPHMGWNTLKVVTPHALLDGIKTGPQGPHAYFVHSFQLVPEARAAIVAETDYGGPVTAMVAKDNMAGTQFHDLHIASVMREHGITDIRTADTDFHQFKFLRVSNPLVRRP